MSRDARVAIRALDEVLRDVTPEQMLQGVLLPIINVHQKRLGVSSLLLMITYLQIASLELPGDDDHRIINCAVYLQKQYSDAKVVLVTKDINMRLKARGAGLHYVEDYQPVDQLIDDITLLTSGYKK